MARLRSALRWFFVLCTFAALAPAARAQLHIEITGATAQRTPVAVVPFAGETALQDGITSIVRVR